MKDQSAQSKGSETWPSTPHDILANCQDGSPRMMRIPQMKHPLFVDQGFINAGGGVNLGWHFAGFPLSRSHNGQHLHSALQGQDQGKWCIPSNRAKRRVKPSSLVPIGVCLKGRISRWMPQTSQVGKGNPVNCHGLWLVYLQYLEHPPYPPHTRCGGKQPSKRFRGAQPHSAAPSPAHQGCRPGRSANTFQAQNAGPLAGTWKQWLDVS